MCWEPLENHVFLPERESGEEHLKTMKERQGAVVATMKATMDHLGQQAPHHVLDRSVEMALAGEPLLVQAMEEAVQALVAH